MWQLPTPVSMTGTVDSSTTVRISPAPPRGMMRSTMPRSRSSALTESWSTPGTRLTTSAGSPTLSAALRRTAISAVLLWYAEPLPRSSATLPLLRQSPAASTVTLGRASYTIPTTPNGTRTCRISSPLASVWPRTTSPTGSGSPATWRSPSAIPSMRAGVRVSRSIMAADVPFAAAAATSRLLAARRSADAASSASRHRR